MCGFAGVLDRAGRTQTKDLQTVGTRMADAIIHRGPDDSGVWVDAECGIALAHRRLSIIDLSPNGHQPMHSASGRYVVAYNGELYNYRELRKDLLSLGHRFRGDSDTEVLLAAVEEWGLAKSLPKFNAMFAIALWDRQERELFLARDRFGEKPLYYGKVNSHVLFGSELKALRAHPEFNCEIDRGALMQLMRFAYVPTPRSIFTGIEKLPPGSWRSFRADGSGQPVTRYWSIADVANAGARNRVARSDAEATEELDRQLRRSVEMRMAADVPLGAFLSGGIDSSTIVALMQALSTKPVRTFTIGFDVSGYNEAVQAKAVAAHLKTDHTELYVTPHEAQNVIPRLPVLYDEPFADSSQIPTFLVSQLARQHVTVALSGDGGDELFGGYNRYFWAEAIWRKVGPLPYRARLALARALLFVRPATVDLWFKRLDPYLPLQLRQRVPGDKVHKLANVLKVHDTNELYFSLVSTWKNPGELVEADEPPHPLFGASTLTNFTDRMMCTDTMTYLPDDILVKVDRAGMGVSLEGRIPFLDPDVAEFAWSLSREQRIRDGKGKWLLREVLARYAPRALFERPKMGFGIPIDEWLRGPLRAWANDLLSPERVRRDGYLRPEPLQEKLREHVTGQRNWQHHLWPALMFQAWLANSSPRAPISTSASVRGAGEALSV